MSEENTSQRRNKGRSKAEQHTRASCKAQKIKSSGTQSHPDSKIRSSGDKQTNKERNTERKKERKKEGKKERSSEGKK